MLETFPLIVKTSTKLPSSSPLSPPSSSLSSLSLSSSSSFSTSPSSSLLSSSSPLSLNPPPSSSSSQFHFTFLWHQKFACHLHIWIHLCFFNYLFLLFIGFRCNILFRNISIDFLLIPLVFWNILVLSINNFQNLSCAKALNVDWC